MKRQLIRRTEPEHPAVIALVKILNRPAPWDSRPVTAKTMDEEILSESKNMVSSGRKIGYEEFKDKFSAVIAKKNGRLQFPNGAAYQEDGLLCFWPFDKNSLDEITVPNDGDLSDAIAALWAKIPEDKKPCAYVEE